MKGPVSLSLDIVATVFWLSGFTDGQPGLLLAVGQPVAWVVSHAGLVSTFPLLLAQKSTLSRDLRTERQHFSQSLLNTSPVLG